MQFRRAPLLVATTLALFAAATTPASLAAQAAPAASAAADSMAFPRQVVKWFLTAQADSLYNHAGTELKSSMQSPASIVAMMGRLSSRLGEHKSTDAEVQFEQNGARVYIVAVTFSQAPERGAFVVRYVPGSPVIESFSVSQLARVKEHFPEAKLP